MERRRGKKYKKLLEKAPTKLLSLKDAVDKVRKLSFSSFDGSVELHVSVILPKDKDPKSIKGSVSLPHMQAKNVVVAIAVPSGLEKVAKDAGANIYNMETLLEGLKAGKVDFDILLAVPETMSALASQGKALGPKGLMPNPKNGTVIDPKNIEGAISEFKRGKLIFKADSAGGIHISVGKISYSGDKLAENTRSAIQYIANLFGKSKELVVRKAVLAPTMGPSVSFDVKLMD